MATCSNSKQGFSSSEEVVKSNNPVFCADSLVGKKIINLLPFELYDKPNGEIIYNCDYENGYTCIAGEIKDDWIRLDYIRSNTDKLTMPFYGWAKWCSNDSIIFKVIGEAFPFVSPYDENAVYEFQVYSQEYPQYPGGEEAIEQFLKKEVQKRYPPTARQMGVQGRVTVSFVVEKDGTMSDFRIQNSVNDEIDEAAIECIKNLPKRWKPTRTKLEFDTAERTVRCKVKLPVSFRIE
ncbi:energy transducer TonB [Bacteroides ovatus]|uniref:energy transducer TonB n=1 Tax=Bacteroides ovatus TaxID=28116 RepID=UPI0018A0ADA9|nr:energy transducer TonB [Bacteroides ovatus]MDC2661307.1 energy transducer TonB [Bacteroides ovatus]